jgi:hypothetical protein
VQDDELARIQPLHNLGFEIVGLSDGNLCPDRAAIPKYERLPRVAVAEERGQRRLNGIIR